MGRLGVGNTYIFVSVALSMELGQRRWAAWGATGCSEGLAPWMLRNEAGRVGGSFPKALHATLSFVNSAEDIGVVGSIPESGRSPGEESGNPLQYSCLGNSMDSEAWLTTVHGVVKSQT